MAASGSMNVDLEQRWVQVQIYVVKKINSIEIDKQMSAMSAQVVIL